MIDRMFELKSATPLSPYAPDYKFELSRAVWDDEEKVDKIKKFLIKKEKDVLKLPYLNDACTGLNEDSVTTRYARYNLFDFADECPELKDLWKFFQEHWYERIQKDNTRPYKTKIVCWFNILRKGDKMEAHSHNSRFSAYLSGNFHLDNYDTATTYKFMDDWTAIDNVKGGLIMFPSQLLHEVDSFEDEGVRISIAFDLHLTNLNDFQSEVIQSGARDFFTGHIAKKPESYGIL